MGNDVATPVYSVRVDYSTLGAALNAWSQVVAALPQTADFLEIFDSGGSVMSFGLGAEGSESQLFMITPGGNGQIPIFIPTLSRISVQPLDVAPTSGQLVINFYQE
jgi:hypothetical protein